MAKNIFDLVLEKKAAMKKNKAMAGQNMAMAIAAIRDGMKSPAWQFYVSQFVDQTGPGQLNKDQLARLMATDNTAGDPVLDRQRAYLVANGVCGVSTVDNFDLSVETIDYSLPDAEDCVPRAFECEGGLQPRTLPSKKRKAGKYRRTRG